jgi:hypothetical protein
MACRMVGLFSRLDGAVSSGRGAFDFAHERVGQFDLGDGAAAPGNMNAKLREPVELTTEPLRKVRRQQGWRDGDDCEAGARRAIS